MKNKLIFAGLLFAVLVYIVFIRRKNNAGSLDKVPQYFTIDIIKSRGNPPPPELAANAQELLNNINIIQHEFYKIDPSYTVQIHSTYRSPAHNAAVGGVPNSYHLQARAVDFSVPNAPSAKFVHQKIMDWIGAGILPKGGVGQGDDFTHYDNKGTNTSWAYTHGSGAGTYDVDFGTAARMAQQPAKLIPIATSLTQSINDLDI